MNSTFEVISGLLGGLAIFLFGMNMMSDCLQKAAGDKMRSILALLTKNPVLGVLAGACLLYTSETETDGFEREACETPIKSRLTMWPVQIQLVPVGAEFFNGADLLIAADCTAYAYGDFHNEFIRGRVCLLYTSRCV